MGIIAECRGAIEAVKGRQPYVYHLTRKSMVTITSYWRAWPCLFPQHGPGRYEYPRYQFSNRSQDIKDLFTSTCDMLGIEWRPWGRHHISVARRESVALMDEFIGPKC